MDRIIKISFYLALFTAIASCQAQPERPANAPPIRAIETPTAAAKGYEANSPAPATDMNLDETLINIDFTGNGLASPEYYGTNGWWSDQDAEIWKTRYQQLGVKIVRFPAIQSMFEPVNDDAYSDHINPQGFLFDQPLPWSDRTITLQKYLQMLRDSDITVMLNIPYLAGWLSANGDDGLYSTYPPKDINEYREYVRALLEFTVIQVGFSPEKVIFEPVNEPDLGCSPEAVVSCFWKNWQANDLISVLQAAYDEAKKVDPLIRVVGVAECCGTTLIDHLISTYNGSAYLDGFTYHQYVSDFNFSGGIQRGIHLQNYGKPVFIDEFGNTVVWSNGVDGALWHSYILPQIWKADINPLQFPISDFPGSHEGFNQLGLFSDWRDSWKIKPAYWVYTNFYNHFGGGEIISVTTPTSLNILTTRQSHGESESLSIWLTNIGTEPINALRFRIDHFPSDQVQVLLLDNLSGSDPVERQSIEGKPLEFYFDLPARSSYCIVLNATAHDLFLPQIIR